jgi:methionyl-tRNA formyltransferase
VKVALLTCDQPWQRTLASRLAGDHELVLVVTDEHFTQKARVARALGMLRRPGELLRKIRYRAAVKSIESRDNRIYRDFFESRGALPFDASALDVLRSADISSGAVAERVARAGPDVIVVSGTRLIRPPVLELRTPIGMVNVHTGLSPYYRGGPCTFWSLYNEEPEYAGVTVHHLSPGIDSGDIILTARPELDVADGAASLDCKVVDLGHRLVLRALSLLAAGRAPRVPQWEKGRVFLHKQFTAGVRLGLEEKLASGLMARCLRRIREHPPILRTVDAA